jgi:hypothetical protein
MAFEMFGDSKKAATKIKMKTSLTEEKTALGDELIQSMEEALAHARGEQVAVRVIGPRDLNPLGPARKAPP